jgi:gamma-glutamyltranspeptidase / glutathione hydrolase
MDLHDTLLPGGAKPDPTEIDLHGVRGQRFRDFSFGLFQLRARYRADDAGPMNIKKIARWTLSTVVLCGLLATGIRYWLARDPTPILLDAKLYDDYAGYYDFGHGYIITIRREANRLMSYAPETIPKELLAQTETKFFFKGQPERWAFERDDKGQVSHLTVQWGNVRERAERRSDVPVNPEGTTAMIAATTGGKAVEAGIEILKEGGTAADAALVTALCEVVHAAGSYVSFGGPFMMVYYDAASGKVSYLDAQYSTPLEETEPRSIPKTGGRTALVPGFMAGVQAAHGRFGKVPFKRLFDHAIALAENGEIVSPVMARWIGTKKSVLSRFSETKKIFARKDGGFYVKGDLFRQPELAATLTKVAANGATYMYDGEWGQKFVEVIRKNGGKITREDMKSYKAIWEEPLQTAYREYQVYAPGISAWGGVSMVEGLNLLELANLKANGHYTTSPPSLFWFMQIAACQKLTSQWREFSEHDLSPKSRATKATSTWIWQQMQSGKWPWLSDSMKKRVAGGSHSDGLVVVDQWGNMAVVNHTINTVLWGDSGIFVDGVSIPDSAAFQPGEVAKAGPGNRLPNGMSPLIFLRDGKPVLGCAAVGGGLHAKTLQTLANVFDFGMDPQAAVDTPAFVGWNAGTVEQDTFDPKVLDGLKEFGVKVKPISSEEGHMARGYWVGVQVDPETRRMRGGVSRGLESQVAGY